MLFANHFVGLRRYDRHLQSTWRPQRQYRRIIALASLLGLASIHLPPTNVEENCDPLDSFYKQEEL